MPVLVAPAWPWVSQLESIPDLDFEVSLSPPSQGPVWRSVIGDVPMSGLTVSRGRSDELQQASPGTLKVALNNRHRYYDPDYTGSPMAGHIKPVRRCRLLARYAGVTYVVFDGYIDQWMQRREGRDAVVDINATDGFKILAKSRIANSSYMDAVLADSPNVYYKFDDSGAPTVLNDAGLLNNDGTYSGTPQFTPGLVEEDIGPALLIPASSPGVGLGVHTVDMSAADWACEFWFSTTSATASIQRAIATWRNNDIGAGIWLEQGKLRYQTGAHASTPTYYETTDTLNDGAVHHVVLRWTGTVEWVIDGVIDAGTSAAGGSFQFTGGSPTLDNGEVFIGFGHGVWKVNGSDVEDFEGTIDEFALYDPVLTAVQAQAHYAAGTTPYAGDLSGTRVTRILDASGWPTALRDIDTGTATLQAVDTWNGEYALDMLQILADTERGQMYMGLDGDMSSDHVFKFVWRERGALTSATRSTVSNATLGDGGGAELLYEDIETDPSGETFLFNDVEVGRRGGEVQHVSDAASIEEYLIRNYSVSGLEFSTDAQALTLAQALLAKYKEPHERIVGLTIRPFVNPTLLFPQVLGREIGDVITIVTRPSNVGSADTRTAIIVGVSHEMQNAEWITTWRLSEAETL